MSRFEHEEGDGSTVPFFMTRRCRGKSERLCCAHVCGGLQELLLSVLHCSFYLDWIQGPADGPAVAAAEPTSGSYRR